MMAPALSPSFSLSADKIQKFDLPIDLIIGCQLPFIKQPRGPWGEGEKKGQCDVQSTLHFEAAIHPQNFSHTGDTTVHFDEDHMSPQQLLPEAVRAPLSHLHSPKSPCPETACSRDAVVCYSAVWNTISPAFSTFKNTVKKEPWKETFVSQPISWTFFGGFFCTNGDKCTWMPYLK